MLNGKKQLTRTQCLSAGLIFLLLLVAMPVAAQTAEVGDVSYGGDDPYDPAAGGLPTISLNPVPQHNIWGCSTTLSGDDPYDPAALCLLLLSDAWAPERTARRQTTTFSGDDLYDPAAGGLPAFSVTRAGRNPGSEISCAPSADEPEARRTQLVDGGFSGDDAYDPAAGGTPERSLLASGLELADCVPITSGN